MKSAILAKQLNDVPVPPGSSSVLYLMNRDRRLTANPALIAAQNYALSLKLPLAVLFCLHATSGFRTRRSSEAILEELQDIEQELKALNIPLILVIGDPVERLQSVGRHFNLAALFVEFPTNQQLKNIVETAAKLLNRPIYTPIESSSNFNLTTHQYRWPKPWYSLQDLAQEIARALLQLK